MTPVFAGRPDGMERELVAKQGFKFYRLSSSGFFGKGPGARLLAGANALGGLRQAAGIIRNVRPSAIVAAGGFGSFTPLLAARLLNQRYFLLEQNRIPGRVTRYFAPGAVETFLTFPLLKPVGGRCVVTGTPLRRSILGGVRNDDGRTVLVLGGSGGARSLSLAGLEMARQLPDLHFIILTGRRDHAMIRGKLEAAPAAANVELLDFTLAMELLYARASLIVSRAGGMVINEILSYGIPSILVPFPFATDDHQEANACHLALRGASIQIDQSRLPELTRIVRELFADPKRLTELAARARRMARRNAAERIADRVVRRLGFARQPLPCSIRHVR